MKRTLGLLLLVLAAAAVVPSARADDKLQQSTSQWKMGNDCAREAFKKFPDYTPAGNAQRENYRRACLRRQGLPAPVDQLQR